MLIGALLLFFRPRGLGGLMQPLLRTPWIGWAGAALVAIGLGFAGWARFHLGRLWSGRVTLKEDHAIIRTGPYGIVRHPIYTGLVLALVGTGLAQGTVPALAGLVLIVIGLLIKIRQEERLLTDLKPNRERIRDVRQGPDGALYLLTDSSAGRVLKLVPRR